MASRSDPWKPVLVVVIIAIVLAVALGAMGWWMGGWGWGAGGMMGFGALWMLVPLLLLVALVVSLAQPRDGERDAGAGARGEDARSLLERRYAAGDITREEYLQKRDDLSGGRGR